MPQSIKARLVTTRTYFVVCMQLSCVPVWLLPLWDTFPLTLTPLLHTTIKRLPPMAVLRATACLEETQLDNVSAQVQGMQGGVELLQLVKVTAAVYCMHVHACTQLSW